MKHVRTQCLISIKNSSLRPVNDQNIINVGVNQGCLEPIKDSKLIKSMGFDFSFFSKNKSYLEH